MSVAVALGAFDESGRHRYLSTSCLHELHDYCQAKQVTGEPIRTVGGDRPPRATPRPLVREKEPARCKFCSAWCICSCHD